MCPCSQKARGRGYGSRLFERAVIHARNEGVDMLFIHALSENTAMLKIARNAGAMLERAGSETEAYLRLPRRRWTAGSARWWKSSSRRPTTG